MIDEAWRTYYWGRKWDAPMTDDSRELPTDVAEAMFNGEVVTRCPFCVEPLGIEDDIFITPSIRSHLECNIRSAMGDVQHLEGRCLCSRGRGNEVTYDSDHYETYREGSKAALQWLIDHRRGRFHT